MLNNIEINGEKIVSYIEQLVNIPSPTGYTKLIEDYLIKNAREKLMRKGLDLIVANDVSAPDSGFSVETNRVVLLSPDGTIERWPLLDKVEVAERILDRVVKIWEERKYDENSA